MKLASGAFARALKGVAQTLHSDAMDYRLPRIEPFSIDRGQAVKKMLVDPNAEHGLREIKRRLLIVPFPFSVRYWLLLWAVLGRCQRLWVRGEPPNGDDSCA